MVGFKLSIIHLWIAAVESVSVLQGTELNKSCLPEQYCTKLFKLQYNVSWHQATGFCRDIGMEPLAILNYTIQDEVMTVLEPFHTPHINIAVWLAGQRSLNASWTSVDPDSIFIWNGQDIIGENSDTKNCLTGTYSSSGSPIYQVVSCNDTQTDNKLICQVKCATPGGKCYHAANKTSTDWYTAQSLCHGRYGGDLLDALPLRYSDLGSLTAWLPKGDTVWIGTWRRYWRWKYKAKDDWYNMRYFNWAPGAGGKFSVDPSLCTVIRSDTGLWQDVHCDKTYQHVLCMDENTDTLTTTDHPPTVGASTAVSTPSLETTKVNIGSRTSSSIQDTTERTIISEGHTRAATTREDSELTTSGLKIHSVENQESAFRLVYIAVIVAVLVVVAGVVLAVVFVRRCSAEKSANQEVSGSGRPGVTANNYIDLEEVDNTRVPNQVLFSSSYEEVPDDLQVIYSKQITTEQPPVGDTAVYALATGEDTPDIQHIVTTQGDEYALPNKSSNNVADAYSSAGFDCGEISAENREEATPLEKINSGNVSGAIDHLVTPEGDEYALPSRRMAPTVAAGNNPDDGEDIMVDSAQYGSLI